MKLTLLFDFWPDKNKELSFLKKKKIALEGKFCLIKKII